MTNAEKRKIRRYRAEGAIAALQDIAVQLNYAGHKHAQQMALNYQDSIARGLPIKPVGAREWPEGGDGTEDLSVKDSL